MATKPTELIQMLSPYPEEVQQLVLRGREFLLERYGPVSEMHFDATNAVCAAVTYVPSQKACFVNFAAYPKHVTLIFPYGVRLTDPQKRLKGEGSQVRHIKLKGMESLQDPYVLSLIDEASAQAPRPEGPVSEEIIVKIYNGPKRRPSPVDRTW